MATDRRTAGIQAVARTHQRESLEKSMDHLLEECRMVLPGVQALFGFQLVGVFSDPFFDRLGTREQVFHLAALVLTAIAVAMLLAPAAYHRQAEPGIVSQRFLTYAGRLVTGAMVPLMLGLSIDVHVIAMAIFGLPVVGALLGLLVFSTCALLWFAIPLARRAR